MKQTGTSKGMRPGFKLKGTRLRTRLLRVVATVYVILTAGMAAGLYSASEVLTPTESISATGILSSESDQSGANQAGAPAKRAYENAKISIVSMLFGGIFLLVLFAIHL